MPLFTSPKERRLWIFTLIVMIAIYATLAFARALADQLAETGLGAWLFICCCLLVLAAVLTQGLRSRPGPAEIAVALGISAAYILVFVRMSIPTERSHLIEYGVVALFIHEALKERKRNARRVPLPALSAIAITTVLGAIDETIQLPIPSRVFAWQDIFFNTLAATMAVTANASLTWARTRFTRTS